jgi:hypothetical protein
MFGKFRLTVLGLLMALVALTPATIGAASDKLPDLALKRLRDLRIAHLSDGTRVLRFSSVIVDRGVGPFEVHGRRPNRRTSMTVTQRIYNDAGGYRTQSTSAQMVFGGDGHGHWHVRDLQEFVLRGIDDTAVRRVGAKRGFCFFDNETYNLSLSGAPQSPVYTSSNSCTGGSRALRTQMGLSVGWGDLYSYSLPDQYVNIHNLPPGRYRLQATVDPLTKFVESSVSNNVTYVDISLNADGTLSIIGYGPSA